MAVETKDKVITVELLGSVADAQKTYIDKVKTDLTNQIEELPSNEDLLEAASSEDVQDIISKFSVA